jgi:hypothetical protein
MVGGFLLDAEHPRTMTALFTGVFYFFFANGFKNKNMSANKRLFLVAVDGPLNSSKAAERAAELAHYERQDRIVLLSVAHPKEKDDPQVVPLSISRPFF